MLRLKYRPEAAWVGTYMGRQSGFFTFPISLSLAAVAVTIGLAKLLASLTASTAEPDLKSGFQPDANCPTTDFAHGNSLSSAINASWKPWSQPLPGSVTHSSSSRGDFPPGNAPNDKSYRGGSVIDMSRRTSRLSELGTDRSFVKSSGSAACGVEKMPAVSQYKRDQDEFDQHGIHHNDPIIWHVEVPAGATVVIGSLDVTGSPHEVSVSIDQAAQGIPSGDDRFSADDPDGRTCAAIVSPAPSFCQQTTQTETLRSSETISVQAPGQTRRFLVPHFDPAGVIQQPTECELICQSSGVSVFVDGGLASRTVNKSDSLAIFGGIFTPAGQTIYAGKFPNKVVLENSGQFECSSGISPTALAVASALENCLLSAIGEWIGQIPDLDGDGRMAVVLTDLDRRQQFRDTPILGCVRDRDFRAYGADDLAGDIIYLDYRLPSGSELTALLAHELTHAAVISMELDLTVDDKDRSQIPAWLNEAVAHWVELQFCISPAGFENRLLHFQNNPAACPVVAGEGHVTLAARRGGCRAAGALFLQRFVSDPEDLRRLLADQRPFMEALQGITECSFADLFRTWSVEQAGTQRSREPRAVRTLARGKLRTQRLYGTSFFVLPADEELKTLTVVSGREAQLQLTVLSSSRSQPAVAEGVSHSEVR